MPTCTICQTEKPDDAFRVFKVRGGSRRRSECEDCEIIIKERRKEDSTFAEKILPSAIEVEKLDHELEQVRASKSKFGQWLGKFGYWFLYYCC